jgi:superfamily I DNA/RNA helicase
VTTGKGAVGEAAAELAQEQAYVTMLYKRLDAMRAGTARRLAEVRLGPTAENDQGWSEREMFAQEYVDRGAELDAPVAVLTPEQSKGLEFDSVIIVDPAGIEQASPRGRADLYVALTRTTRRLGLVSHGELPGGLTAVLDQRIGGRL